MLVDRVGICWFLPDRRELLRAMGGGLLLVWLPVCAFAQILIVEMARGPLEDRRLREAIVASTDWMRVAEETGLNVRSVSLSHAGETQTKRATPQDIEKAKLLLREMGGVSGQTPLVLLFDPQSTEKLAELVAANLRPLGLPLRMVALPEDARAETQRMMRSRTDISRSEPGLIMLSWSPAAILEPRQPVPRPPEIVRPEPPTRDDVVPLRHPDLIVPEFHAFYDPGAQLLTVEALIINIGQGAAAVRFAVAFPEGTGAVGDLLGLRVAGPLAPGGSQWVETQIRINDSMLGRTVRLRAVADAAQTVHETNERNNASAERRVFLERPEPLLPDLTVEALQLDYDPMTHALTARVLVRNAGKGPTTAPATVELASLSDAVPGGPERRTIGTLAPGAAIWIGLERQVPPGSVGQVVELQARADPEGRIREANERNNDSAPERILLERPSAPRLPDLIIAQLDPSYDRLTRRLTVRVSVRNVGDAPAGQSRLRILETEKRFGLPDISIPSIAPGDSAMGMAEVIVPEKALGDVALLEAMANADKKLREADLKNNGFGPIRVVLEPPPQPERPDLVIAGFDARHDPASGEIAVRLAIRNEGRSETGPFEVMVSDHTYLVEAMKLSFAELAPGRTEDKLLRIPVRAVNAPRSVLLQAEADAGDNVRESDEGNNLSNRRRLVLQPQPEPERPDLQLDRLIVEHDAARSRVVLRIVVVNAGSVPSAATRVHSTDLTGHVPDLDLNLQALAPGQRITLRSEQPLAPWPEGRILEFVARADADARVNESREDNNESQVAMLRIPPTRTLLPDLSIDSLAASQSRVRAPLDVTAEIVNIGEADSAATELVLRIDGTSRVVEQLPALRIDEAHRIRLQVPVQEGFFGGAIEVALEVDPEKRIAETTHTNNVFRRQVVLQPPPWLWIAGGVTTVAALLLTFRLIAPGRGVQPEPQAKIPPHLVRLRPRAHPGRQSAEPAPDAPGIALEFSMRPSRDLGRVTVERFAKRGKPEK